MPVIKKKDALIGGRVISRNEALGIPDTGYVIPRKDALAQTTFQKYWGAAKETIAERVAPIRNIIQKGMQQKVEAMATPSSLAEAAIETSEEATQKRLKSIKTWATKTDGLITPPYLPDDEDIKQYKRAKKMKEEPGIYATPVKIKPGALPDETYAVFKFLKEVGIPVASKEDLEHYKEAYKPEVSDPPLTIAGGVAAKLLWGGMISSVPVPEAVSSGLNLLKDTHPKLALGLAKAISIGEAFATSEAINQVSKVITGDEKITPKILNEPAKKGAFGMSVGGIWGIENIPARSILSGLNVATWTILDRKMQDGKVTPEAIKQALTEAGIVSLFTAGFSIYGKHVEKKILNKLLAENRVHDEIVHASNLAEKENNLIISKQYMRLLNNGRLDEAVQELNKLPESMRDYVKGIHGVVEAKQAIMKDPNIKEMSSALLIKQMPKEILSLPGELQYKIIFKELPAILAENNGNLDVSIKAVMDKFNIPKVESIQEQILPEEVKAVKDNIPTTPVPELEMATEGEKGAIDIAKAQEELKKLPIKQYIDGISSIVKTVAGNEKEFYQEILGEEKGKVEYEKIRFYRSGLELMNDEIDAKFKEIFKGIPANARNNIGDVIRGIKGLDAEGNIEFGAIRESGKIPVNEATEGTILEDGRLVGKLNEKDGGKTRIAYRKFDTKEDYKKLITTYPKAKTVIDRYLAVEEDVAKTKLGQAIPSFANNIFMDEFDIKREVEEGGGVYLPSVKKDEQFIAKLRNMFRYSTEGGRYKKLGSLYEQGLEERDFAKAYKLRQKEFAFIKFKNDISAEILANTIKPVVDNKVDFGWTKIDLNEPRIAKLIKEYEYLFKSVGVTLGKISPLESVMKYKLMGKSSEEIKNLSTPEKQAFHEEAFKELKNFERFLVKNKIKIDNLSSYQVPTALLKEFDWKKADPFFTNPNAIKAIDGIEKLGRNFINYISLGYLGRLATATRNLVSGTFQDSLRLFTRVFEGDLIAAKEIIKAPITSLRPSIIKELPRGLLGGRGTNQIGDTPAFMVPIKIAASGMEAVEQHLKRATFLSEFNTLAIKSFNDKLAKGEVSYKDKTQYIKDYRENYLLDSFQKIRDEVDLYALDYQNKPLLLKYLPKAMALFPNYIYHYTRLSLEHSPLALIGANKSNINRKRAMVLSGMVAFAGAWVITNDAIEERKKQKKLLATKKIDVRFDTTGRLKFYANKEVEQWLRVYDLALLGEVMYFREIMNDTATIGDWMQDRLSIGPLVKIPMTIYGLKSEREKFKDSPSILGKEVAGWIYLAPLMKYLRVLSDRNMRKVYSEDYSAFENFINPILDATPILSKTLEPSIGKTGIEKGKLREYDIPTETIKLLSMNLKSIDKEEYAFYALDQITSGKVRKRINAKIKKNIEAKLRENR